MSMELRREILSDPDKGRQMLRSIFQVDGTAQPPIIFIPEISQGDRIVIQTPLQQLFQFYYRWNDGLPVAIRDKKDPVEVKEGVRIYDELTGSPRDLFDSLQSVDAEKDVLDVVENAQKAVMLGAIGVPSVYDVGVWLRDNRFRGELDVYDISSVPLAIGKLYQEHGFLNDLPKVNFIHDSALNVQRIKNSGGADIIISDVLGYYLSLADYGQLIDTICLGLNNGGVWLTRELIEPDGVVPPNQRTVRRIFTKTLSDFSSFIQQMMDVKLTEEQLTEWEATRWLRVPTFSRQLREDYIPQPPAGLSMIADVKASTSFYYGKEPRRIFETMVFRKTQPT